jgi:hypothetical protein
MHPSLWGFAVLPPFGHFSYTIGRRETLSSLWRLRINASEWSYFEFKSDKLQKLGLSASEVFPQHRNDRQRQEWSKELGWFLGLASLLSGTICRLRIT